jgi:hypothetical protein
MGNSQAEEIPLFGASGTAVAYVDTEDELTIYLWNGKPVAYMEDRDGGALHVWGFNGKHLGWFEKGAIWDRSGGASCAVKEAFRGITNFEPFKSFKQFRPFKSFKEFAPFKPFLSGNFGSMPCSVLLGSGAN